MHLMNNLETKARNEQTAATAAQTRRLHMPCCWSQVMHPFLPLKHSINRERVPGGRPVEAARLTQWPQCHQVEKKGARQVSPSPYGGRCPFAAACLSTWGMKSLAHVVRTYHQNRALKHHFMGAQCQSMEARRVVLAAPGVSAKKAWHCGHLSTATGPPSGWFPALVVHPLGHKPVTS